MKISIDIDCTPEEARAFLGLPDVSKVNSVIMDGIQKRTEENLDAFTDPQKFYDKMMAGSAGNLEAVQKMFAGMMAAGGTKSE